MDAASWTTASDGSGAESCPAWATIAESVAKTTTADVGDDALDSDIDDALLQLPVAGSGIGIGAAAAGEESADGGGGAAAVAAADDAFGGDAVGFVVDDVAVVANVAVCKY